MTAPNFKDFPFVDFADFVGISFDVTHIVDDDNIDQYGLVMVCWTKHAETEEQNNEGMVMALHTWRPSLVELAQVIDAMIDLGILSDTDVYDRSTVYSIDGEVEAEFLWTDIADHIEDLADIFSRGKPPTIH